MFEAEQADLGGNHRHYEQKCGRWYRGIERQPMVGAIVDHFRKTLLQIDMIYVAEQCWKHNTERNPGSFVKGASTS